jgi:alkylation response protein AidB-like acyl-CoA dehydrogenase
MDFDFSDDQIALREAVARWVDRAFPFERRHAAARAGGHSREVWQELADLGLCALAVPDEHGGLQAGPIEAMVVMEELGRGLVHAPYAAAALIAPAMFVTADASLRANWLPRIASGQALVVLAHQERAARHRLDRTQSRAEPAPDGRWRLTGTKSVVPAGDEADAWIVPARCEAADGPVRLFLVERGADGAGLRSYPTQDGARSAELTLSGAAATLLRDDGAQALQLAADIGIAAACAEGTGLMERLLAMTAEYLNTRRQFGAPLASFQALRHRVADLKMQLELARSMSYYASMKLDEPAAARSRAMALAKVQLGRSMREVGQQCIQLHGGIGVTDEYAASHYFKRLTVLELGWGDTLHHLATVSAGLQDHAGVFA